jgi:hypothetical protein
VIDVISVGRTQLSTLFTSKPSSRTHEYTYSHTHTLTHITNATLPHRLSEHTAREERRRLVPLPWQLSHYAQPHRRESTTHRHAPRAPLVYYRMTHTMTVFVHKDRQQSSTNSGEDTREREREREREIERVTLIEYGRERENASVSD